MLIYTFQPKDFLDEAYSRGIALVVSRRQFFFAENGTEGGIFARISVDGEKADREGRRRRVAGQDSGLGCGAL